MRHPPALSPALPPLPSRSGTRGFTLIELMVTLSVLVVVMSVAVPSMSEFSASNQVAAAKSSFAGAVALARTEAARRGKTVILQPVSAGPDGNEYLNGWEIVADDDGDGVAGANEPRLRRAATSYEKIKLSGARSLAFRASGALAGSSAQVYTVCRVSGSSAGYSITITPSGVADVATITTCG